MATPHTSASRPIPVAPILIAMALGALVGWLTGPDGYIGGVEVMRLFDFLGTLFINLLKMLIVPLVMASIIIGVASLGSGRDLGRLGIKTLIFYVITTLLAILIALAIINIVKPGIVNGEPAHAMLALEAQTADVTASVKERAAASVYDMLLSAVPDNIVAAAANLKLLGLVFFSLVFGFFLARIDMPYRQTVLRLLAGRLSGDDAHDGNGHAGGADRSLCTRGARRCQGGLQCSGADARLWGLRPGWAAHSRFHCAAAVDSARRAGESMAPLPGHEPRPSDRIFLRLVIGYAANEPRVRREARRCLRAHHELRHAARRDAQSCRQCAV